VRLVVNPEVVVVAETQRTYTTLCLLGYQVDAVVVNRMLPEQVTDPYFDGWKARQREHLATVRERFAGLPLLTVPLFEGEPVGVDALGLLGSALYDRHGVADVLCREDLLTLEREVGGYVLRLRLPLAGRGDVEVLRRGDDLYVKVGGHNRCLALPGVLRRCQVRAATVKDGRLAVRFGLPGDV
jgi:arsenite-transporting ATPase